MGSKSALLRAMQRSNTPVTLKTIYNWCEDSRTIKDWVAKAEAESKKGCTVVLLVPSRTDTSWWHEHCIAYEIEFIRKFRPW